MATVREHERRILLNAILTGQISFISLAALIIALVLGVSVHEFAHAAAATWLGDPTPRRQGRLTLSPAAHLDVVGSLMFLIAGVGWGKPVQYSPYLLRAGPRTGPALVSLAGPAANLILAALLAVPARVLLLMFRTGTWTPDRSNSPQGVLFQLLLGVIFYNLILSILNLIPIFPLDGFTILQGLLPPELAERFELTRQYGIFVLLILFFVGSSWLAQIVYGPADSMLRLLVGSG